MEGINFGVFQWSYCGSSTKNKTNYRLSKPIRHKRIDFYEVCLLNHLLITY